MTSNGDRVVLKANLPRTRDLSFVGRFHHNYGFEEGLFEYLLAQKDLWGDKLFYLDEKEFRDAVGSGQQKIREIPTVELDQLQLRDLEVSPISENEYKAMFGSSEPIELALTSGKNETKASLDTWQSSSLSSCLGRNAIALNVGGFVTAMKWLPYGSLLAVAVMYHEGGLEKAVTSPSLSIFPHERSETDVKSCIQLWEYDSVSTSLSLRNVLVTSAFGATSNINWLPVKTDSRSSGVLSGLFSDGKVHFFKIGEHGQAPDFGVVKAPSWTIAMQDETEESTLLPITSYDFFDETKILVGTLDGAVAEFVLPWADPNPDIPSFVLPIADSAISTVTVAPVLDGHILLVNTTTTRSFALHYETMRQNKVETAYTVSFLQPRYHRGYRIFIYPDSAESIGYTFARHPHQKHTLLLRTELVSSFHVSEYINHPFAIVGNVAGDLYVTNVGRKIFGVPKAHNRLVVPLRIWSLSLESDNKTYKLVGDYVPSTADRSDVAYSFSPHGVSYSACAWNESLDGSSTYAVATYSGLLILERLDPKLK